MKTISKATATLISDFSAETELSLPAYALEKDYHVLDAIKIVSAMPPSAYFSLVFCGGTCLSKAYGILERMSEDVDFKVVSNEAGRTLGTAALRREMSAYVKSIMATLEMECFGKDSVVRRSRDDNKYSALDISYGSVFERLDSLRPHLLLELNYTASNCGIQRQYIGLECDRIDHTDYVDDPARAAFDFFHGARRRAPPARRGGLFRKQTVPTGLRYRHLRHFS